MRRIALGLLALVLTAGCGGSSDGADDTSRDGAVSTSASAELPDWVKTRLAARPGPNVALVLGTSDHAVGPNRITFLVLRKTGELVRSSRVTVIVARAEDTRGIRTTARIVPLGSETHPAGSEQGHDEPDVTELYVLNVTLRETGQYWLVVEPDRESIQAVGRIEVRERTISPPIGTKAMPSENPTLADAPAEEITTARPPDTELLRYSVADSLRAEAPFVVGFATPAFCRSRTCGPTIETVDAVRRTFADEGIRFIHIEVYENNDPDEGVSRWMKEWNLTTEPWVFLVDRKGIIRARFEGSVSQQELVAAVRQTLLG